MISLNAKELMSKVKEKFKRQPKATVETENNQAPRL